MAGWLTKAYRDIKQGWSNLLFTLDDKRKKAFDATGRWFGACNTAVSGACRSCAEIPRWVGPRLKPDTFLRGCEVYATVIGVGVAIWWIVAWCLEGDERRTAMRAAQATAIGGHLELLDRNRSLNANSAALIDTLYDLDVVVNEIDYSKLTLSEAAIPLYRTARERDTTVLFREVRADRLRFSERGRAAQERVTIDLSGSDLTTADLHGLKLRIVVSESARLRDCDLSGSDIEFDHVALSGNEPMPVLTFERCRVENARLQFKNANYHIVFQDSLIRRSRLDNAMTPPGDLWQPDFERTDLIIIDQSARDPIELPTSAAPGAAGDVGLHYIAEDPTCLARRSAGVRGACLGR